MNPEEITRTCTSCKRTRDTDLFDGDARVCELCRNRPASLQAKADRIAQRIRESQTRATRARSTLSDAARYRQQLERSGAGYTDAQISAFVAARYPEEQA